MNSIFKHILLTVAVFSLSTCSEYADVECYTYDYSDCDTQEPFWGYIEVELTINEENPFVPITIYKGNYESRDTDWVDTAYEEFYTIDVLLNQYYTVVAEYNSESQCILAIDGDEIRKKAENVCDSTCWVIKDGYYDVRLKYDD